MLQDLCRRSSRIDMLLHAEHKLRGRPCIHSWCSGWSSGGIPVEPGLRGHHRGYMHSLALQKSLEINDVEKYKKARKLQGHFDYKPRLAIQFSNATCPPAIHLFTHSRIHSSAQSTHSLSYPPTRSYTHSLSHSTTHPLTYLHVSKHSRQECCIVVNSEVAV